MLNLLITPTGPIAALLAEAHKRHEKGGNAGTSSKLRRTRYELKSPKTFSSVDIIRNEPGEKTKSTFTTYHCAANPADYLVGKRALSSNLVCHVAPLQLALFKAGLLELLPSLPDSALESITADDCRVLTFTASVYFQYPDETAVSNAYMDVYRHCKVVADFGETSSGRKTPWKKPPPRVVSDPEHRHAFIVLLPFGQVRASMKRDRDEYPATVSSMPDVEDRKKLCSAIRCLLCFEIEVDLTKFHYIDSDGRESHLPTDYRKWTRPNLREDPVMHIWNALRYELWLSSTLATDESEVDRSRLTWQVEEVLGDYLAGKDVMRHDRMGVDSKDSLKFRETLIDKAYVDILNPWAIAKLNLCKVLGPQLTYESRFVPSDDPDLAPHTLSKGNVIDAISELKAAIQSKLEKLADRVKWDEQ